MTPHPQRCETCTNCNQKKIHARYDKFDTYEFFCNKYQVWIFGTAYNTLEIVGCASHSASEPVAEKCEYPEDCRRPADRPEARIARQLADMLEYLESLRQQEGKP
jgi:hypothetical protein